MSTPKLFVAPNTGGTLLEYDSGNVDNAAGIDFLFDTLPLAPGGIGGECIFYSLRITISHSSAADWTLRLTPTFGQIDHTNKLVQAVAKAAIDVTIPASASAIITITKEIALQEPYSRGGKVRFINAPRGEWMTLRGESVGGVPANDIKIDRLAVEREVLRDMLLPTNST